ncbi:MAG: hypothetical protein PUA93_07130 [Eubacteriales bacterium]|nr:hypothetical protein [Eubacteriales bacterium]
MLVAVDDFLEAIDIVVPVPVLDAEALLNGSMRDFPVLSQMQDFSIESDFFGNFLLGMPNPLFDLREEESRKKEAFF